MSPRTLPIRPRTLRRRLALIGLGAVLAAFTLGYCAPPAHAALQHLHTFVDDVDAWTQERDL